MNIDHKNKIYSIDGLSIKKLANDFGTPCFVYSESTISNNFNEIKNIFNTDKKKVFYSVKANSNLAILKLLNDLGSGFDIVSMGELERVMRIGANPKNIVYSGVGKSEEDIKKSIELGIYCINVESFAELKKLHQK